MRWRWAEQAQRGRVLKKGRLTLTMLDMLKRVGGLRVGLGGWAGESSGLMREGRRAGRSRAG